MLCSHRGVWLTVLVPHPGAGRVAGHGQQEGGEGGGQAQCGGGGGGRQPGGQQEAGQGHTPDQDQQEQTNTNLQAKHCKYLRYPSSQVDIELCNNAHKENSAVQF